MKLKFGILFIFMSGCAYYNTMYNAHEYYKKALASDPPNKDFLEKSVQKCEKLISYYPKSKWVPDAMFLMGKCFVQKQDYEYAITKFKEIISYYPAHKLADNSRVELANAYIEKGDYFKARETIKEIKGYQEDAAALIVESYFMSGEYDTAIKIAKINIKNIKKKDIKSSIYNLIGSSYDSLGKYKTAIKYYNEALKNQPKNLQIVTDISSAYLKSNEPEKALDKLLKYNEVLTGEEKIQLDLMIARCYKSKGDFDKAIEILEKSKTAPKAIYEIGVIYEENLKNLEKAKEYYEKVRTAGNSELANQSLMRASRIDKLLEYKKEVSKISAAKDTMTSAVPDTARQDTMVAITTDTSKTVVTQERPPDITMDTSKTPYINADIEKMPSRFQPPITGHRTVDTTNKDVTARDHSDFPDITVLTDLTKPVVPDAAITAQPDTTKIVTKISDKKDTAKPQDLGKSQFLLAELYFFEFKKIDEAIQEYEKVIADFPKSDYAPKSAYAIGWILENEKNDTTGAVSSYQRVIKNYPNSSKYVNLAREGISRLKPGKNGSFKKR